jgi:hypothetical protein
MASDDWDSFVTAFQEDKRLFGKKYTVGYRREQLPVEVSAQKGFLEEHVVFQEAPQSVDIYPNPQK